MISATDNPFCASISLFSSTKFQPIFFASILPSVDLPAPRKPIKAMPANDIRRCADAPWPARMSLACASWFGVALRTRSRLTGRDQILETRAHRVRHPAQQHDRDVALAAFELGDVAFGNAGDFCQHFSRHAAQRAHGADTLAELLEKAGFGIGIFGHFPCFGSGRERAY